MFDSVFFIVECLVQNFLSRDANISCIGMTTRHLGLRIQKHLHHKTTKSAIRDHFEIYQNCKVNNTDFNGFKVLCICNSEYATKIQEALLIKKKKKKNATHNSIDSSTLMVHLFYKMFIGLACNIMFSSVCVRVSFFRMYVRYHLHVFA